MDLKTFIVCVFCLIDDLLDGKPIRRRGPSPKLSDSEVITMEVVGEFLGIDTDSRASTSTSGATTPNGSPPSRRSTEPPSPVRRPTVLADRNYWSPIVAEQLHDVEGGPTLMARFKLKNETEKERGLVWPRWLSAKRQKIESVFSQLVSRFNMKKVRARDAWHFSSRFVRKILSHTVAVVFCRREGVAPTRFWELLTD